jgi:5-methylthioadenosine/S-adenosylhomocysteine deaminase
MYRPMLVIATSLLFSFPFIGNCFESEKKEVDLIVLGEYLIPMTVTKSETSGLSSRIIKNGAIAIEGLYILDVGTQEYIKSKYTAKKTILGENRVLLPGLINGHTHAAMTLFRGMADDLDLMPWLNNFIFPMEAQFVSPDFIKVGTDLACWEMIKGGITTFVDMYFYPDIISQRVNKCGLRAIVGAPMIDFPSPGFKGWDDSFQSGVDYVKKWQGKNERIIPALAPHAPYTVSLQHLKQVADKARELDAPVSIHIAETLAENKIMMDKHNNSTVRSVYDSGLFDGINTIAAHMVHPDVSDIRLLATNNVGVIHNPTSNLKLAAGISPIVSMLKNQVNIGLGTDGAASNNDMDLWEEIRMVALLQKFKEGDPTVIPAYAALKMATSDGAKAIGLENLVGQLKPGLRADVIQVSLDELRLKPMYNIISHLVYVVDSQDVVTSIVSGKILMEDKIVLTIDEKKLGESIELVSRRIKSVLNR